MSYSMEELRTRLANGESVDTIAKEMTAVLNEAVAAQEAEKVNVQKQADWNDVFAALGKVIKTYYPKTTKYFADIGMTEEEKQEICNAVITAIDEVENEIEDLAAAMIPMLAMRGIPVPTSKKPASNMDAVLENWINSIS